MSDKLKIIFMGTPEFAVASLDVLIQSKHEVVAVVTAPDRPAGRGRKINMPAVKTKALEYHIPVLQPDKLRDNDFLQELKSYQADLFVVVAFRMLPEVVWAMPPKGTFNLHASLLPQYRGAAPINWAIINGEKQTGVTTFFIEHQIDTGDILLSETVDILPSDNASSLHDKLMGVGANLVLKTVNGIADKSLSSQPQPEVEDLKPAPKIFREDCLLDFNQEVYQVHNQVRGLSYYPGAYTLLEDKVLKIFASEVIESDDLVENGNIQSDGKNQLKIKCSGGWLNILELQLEGKRRMSVEDFLKGYKFSSQD